jgi:hypothetical protein
MSLSTVQNFARVLALGYMGTGIASLAFSAPLVTNGDCIANNVGNGNEEVAPVSTTRKNAPTHPTVFYLGQMFLLFWMCLAVESPPRAVVLTLVFSHRGTHPAVSF